MQIIVTNTDTLDALQVARDTIDAIIRRRAAKGEEPPLSAVVAATNASLNKPVPAVASTATIQEAPAPKKAAKAKPAVAKTVSMEEVRQLMVAKASEGKREEAVRVLSSMGFAKLSQVPPEQLVEVKDKVEAL